MQGTTSGFRADPTTRLADLERQRPEWRSWLRLLGEARRVLDDGAWETPLAEAELARHTATAESRAPWLQGRTVEVDPTRVRRVVRRFASLAGAERAGAEGAAAASLRGYRPSAADAVALLGAAVRQDSAALGALAAGCGADPAALTTVAHFAALPLLQSCGRLLQDGVPPSWPHGYCPICAAWPILVERRGLDRTRRLRCGRCAAQWQAQWLCCVYCGEREHERLGSLVLEDGGETLKVETCASCRGYLKSFATLQEIPSFELLLQDLETVELDLVALDRGYARPQDSGFPLDLHVVSRT